MKRTRRVALLLSLAAIRFAVAWDFTPRSSGRSDNGTRAEPAVGKGRFKAVPSLNSVPEQPQHSCSRADGSPGGPGMATKIRICRLVWLEKSIRKPTCVLVEITSICCVAETKRSRRCSRKGDQTDGDAGDVLMSGRSEHSPLVDTTDWVFIGPNPIPLGQTQGTRVPVSGRTISIAIHPTDPDTVYVGTAQGGLYKSTNGGTNWTKLFEFQLETLAIGAITIDPTDSSIVYVGTGENGQSADSFAGKGLYIIRNANSATPTLNGPFRLNGVGADVFSGRSIGRVLVVPSNNNIIFVCTSTGSGGNPNTSTLLPGAARSLSLD